MHLENLKHLRVVGQKILDENLPIGFGDWDCGTHACLGGYYARFTADFTLEDVSSPAMMAGELLAQHFEIPYLDAARLFSPDIHRPWNRWANEDDQMVYLLTGNQPGARAVQLLQQRMRLLDDYIIEAEKLALEDVAARKLPLVITEIFAAPAVEAITA